MDSAADSESVGLNTSRTSAIQCLSATWTVRVWIRKKQTGLINNDVDNGCGLRCIRRAARYEVVSWKKNHFGHWTSDNAACRTNVDYADFAIGSRINGVCSSESPLI